MAGAPRPTIGIIGAGRLGTSLSAAVANAGFNVRLASRTAPSISQQLADASDLVFLTIPDGAIASVCQSIQWRPGQSVVHCSGALGREQLVLAETAGASTGCFHPLQTFPSRAPEPNRFHGIAIGVEAPEPLGSLLEHLAAELGSHPFRTEGIDRALYHAAAVVASNHLIALASAATRLWTLAGLPANQGRQALAPLITAAAANVANLDLADALTGPIARGDAETVARHLAALEASSDLRELYRRLSLELLHLPLALDPGVRTRLESLLE